MNIEYPPFYVGQKVVAIITHSRNNFKKGDEFIVQDIKKSACCGTWLINIGIKTNYDFILCVICGERRPNDDYYRAAAFAPKQQMNYPLIKLSRVLENEPVSAN